MIGRFLLRVSGYAALGAVCAFAAVPSASASDTVPKADVVFVIDESGSMSNEIADVRRNVNVVASTAARQLDARYALVAFGGSPPDGPGSEPFMRTDFTDAAGFALALEGSGSYPGRTRHDEMGLWATTYALTAPTGFREGAGTCVVLVSDESPSFRVDLNADMAEAVAAIGSRQALWYGIADTQNPEVNSSYGTLARASGGGLFAMRAFRSDPSDVLRTIMSRCATRVTKETSGCTITGTAGADVLRGSRGADVICALGGNDIVYGLGGNDTILGGGGSDRLFGGAGNDRVSGGGGKDHVIGGRGRDVLRGGPGRDRLRAGAGTDALLARDGDRDAVDGGPGADSAVLDRRLDVVTRARTVAALPARLLS